MLTNFKPAPQIRPLLNLGCLFDIPTGSYSVGKHGESILNGGLSYVTGLGGRGNTYKSTIAHYMIIQALNRYDKSEAVVYDTEVSLTMTRLEQLSMNMANIQKTGLKDTGRIMLSDKTVMMGNEFFDELRKGMKDRYKKPSPHLLTTPFIDATGTKLKSFNPLLAEIDSLSMFDIESVENMYDAASVGDSKLNTEAMKGAAAKSQMLLQLPGLTGASGSYVIMTAHVGDEIQMDPRAPPAKKLAFLKGKVKFKRVPENFQFLTNNLWYCTSATVMINDTKKTPEFPRDQSDDLKGDTDLMLINLLNVRAKSGPTGLPIEVISSQRDGVHVGLSEFWYIKKYDRFGLGGHDRAYFLELVPDVNMQRTTVRGKIDGSAKLRRALEITSEMCQMTNMWHHLPAELLCTPKELYADLIAKGYDWDILLNTRGYWTFDECITKDTLPFLSTMDLLNIRAGTYVPYWYDKKLLKAVSK